MKETRDTAEGWSQTEEAPAAPLGTMLTAEELDSRLRAQKQSLTVEAGAARERAVKEARRRLQTELQKRHLEDLATQVTGVAANLTHRPIGNPVLRHLLMALLSRAMQVEGAVSRAYGRWLEDLTLLPEYKANLQREKDQWEEILKQKAWGPHSFIRRYAVCVACLLTDVPRGRWPRRSCSRDSWSS